MFIYLGKPHETKDKIICPILLLFIIGLMNSFQHLNDLKNVFRFSIFHNTQTHKHYSEKTSRVALLRRVRLKTETAPANQIVDIFIGRNTFCLQNSQPCGFVNVFSSHIEEAKMFTKQLIIKQYTGWVLPSVLISTQFL